MRYFAIALAGGRRRTRLRLVAWGQRNRSDQSTGSTGATGPAGRKPAGSSNPVIRIASNATPSTTTASEKWAALAPKVR